ncbi:MAG: hypothetical protein QM758_11690 [Armatimonas sp.]
MEKNGMYVGRGILEFGDEEHALNTRRSAMVLDDGGRWTYVEEGELSGFSAIDGFHQEDIKSRLSLEYIQQYCERLGISVFDEEFYTGKGCLIENLSARKWKRRCRDISSYA